MRRRTWMKLGFASAAALSVGGGLFALGRPGWADGRVSPAGRPVFQACADAMLDASLPIEASSRTATLESLLVRVDEVIAGLPPHAQDELSLLLGLLASAPGRFALTGLDVDWGGAGTQKVQQALHGMRYSTVSLRQQAYHALHDITTGAYFSDPSTWGLLGYPGPPQI